MQISVLALILALRGKKLITSSSPNDFLIEVVRATVEIILLQETLIESNPAVIPSATITSKIPSFVSSNQYAWSAWFYKTGWLDWGRIFRIALDTRYSTFSFQINS